jgi:lysyl-tRNA synthetase class 1
MAEENGAPLAPREERILAERLAAARAWLDAYAPETAVVRVRREGLPDEAAMLGEDQRAFLGGLADAAELERPRGGDAWQTLLFRVAGDAGLPAGRAFGAVYLAVLGRPNGPRAGWLLASLDASFVTARLRAAAGPADEGREDGSRDDGSRDDDRAEAEA